MLFKPSKQFRGLELQLLGGVGDADRPAGRRQTLDRGDFRCLIENDQPQRLVVLGLVCGSLQRFGVGSRDLKMIELGFELLPTINNFCA
ncbi:hypothetical protein D3C85_1630600 [compost metagenome]